MKKLLLLATCAILAVFVSCQKDSLSVLNNAPEGYYGTTTDRGGGHHPHGDSTFVCDSLHHHDSTHIHWDSLHIHWDSLHIHLDSLHMHHDSIDVDTTGHGGHGGHGGPGGPGGPGGGHHGHGGGH